MVRLLFLLISVFGSAAVAQETSSPRLELILDARESAPFEGEMVLATLRGTYRQNITREEVKLRPMTDLDWVRLGLDRWSEERIDGLPARIFERRLAFYPKRPGTLEILPIAHSLEVLGADGARETVILRSAPVTLEVQARPEDASQGWLPLSALEMSDHWDTDPSQLEDGQSVTRRVVLRALGATPEMMPPQPELRQPWLISFTPPVDRDLQVTELGPVSTVVWTWTLRPIKGEPGVIPAATIPWFDTARGTPETLTLPASPIGYASFSANGTSGWRALPEFGWASWALLLLSFGTAMALALPPRRSLRHWRRAATRASHLARLRMHVLRRDAPAVRVLAARILEDHSDLDEAARLAVLEPADRGLYSEAPVTHREPLGAVLQATRNAIRGREKH
ncbi:hypothetical protein [Litorisediminicola beolgyonensis]|uniref:Oxygen tolerance n=1 Tax=Litorisediminicola beolgyonensis TaxID=1173614 RepID=A0ABW3ZH49_9RHOB